MIDYRKLRMGKFFVIAMAMVIVGMLSGSVFAAERVAVRTTVGESSPGGNGFGFYVPNIWFMPISVPYLTNVGSESLQAGGQSITVPDLYFPNFLLGYKFGMAGGDTVEPVVGLYSISGSDGGTGTMLGFAGGVKYFHNFMRGSIGNLYGGGTALLVYANDSVKIGDVEYFTTKFGINILANMGVELFPFETLKKLGFTFDAGLPVLGYLSTEDGAKAAGQTQSSKLSKTNFLERCITWSIGVHIYF